MPVGLQAKGGEKDPGARFMFVQRLGTPTTPYVRVRWGDFEDRNKLTAGAT